MRRLGSKYALSPADLKAIHGLKPKDALPILSKRTKNPVWDVSTTSKRYPVICAALWFQRHPGYKRDRYSSTPRKSNCKKYKQNGTVAKRDPEGPVNALNTFRQLRKLAHQYPCPGQISEEMQKTIEGES